MKDGKIWDGYCHTFQILPGSYKKCLLKHNSWASLTWSKLVFWHQMLAMHTSSFCYYQNWHEKADRRSLNRRSYQVLLTVWSILWRKGYSVPQFTPVIPAPFGPLDCNSLHIECFPLTYDISGFTPFKCRFFLNRYSCML